MIYDATTFDGKPANPLPSMVELKGLYHGWFWGSGSGEELPDPERVRTSIEKLPTDVPVFANVEQWASYATWGGATDEQVAEGLAKYKALAEQMRAANPDLTFGYYGVCAPGLGRTITDRLASIYRDIDRIRESRALEPVSFVSVGLYVRYDETFEQWRRRTRLEIALNRELGKPVWGFVCPRYMSYHDNPDLHSQPIPWFVEQVDLVERCADAVVVWDGWDGGRLVWGKNEWVWLMAMLRREPKQDSAMDRIARALEGRQPERITYGEILAEDGVGKWYADRFWSILKRKGWV